MFSALLKKSAKVSGKGLLAVGAEVSPKVRGDGGGGIVLVLGRMGIQEGTTVRYGSKKAPLTVTCEIVAKDGKKETEVFQVPYADGVRLGKVDAAEVNAIVANIKSITIKEIKG